jgi:hypothetical protein
MKRQQLLAIIVLLLSLLFVYATGAKAFAYDRFVSDLGKSPLLQSFINESTLAKSVLGMEFLTVVLLHIPSTKKWGLYAAFIQLLVFTGYLSALYLFYPHSACACNGILGAVTYPAHLIFNGVCTLVALLGIMVFNNLKKRPPLRVVYNAHALTPAVDYQ